MRHEIIRTGTTINEVSPPRDLSGTDAHDKLREALGVPAGGYRREPAREGRSADPNTNLTATILKRAAERQDAQRETALQAHADYQAGATMHELAKRYHMAPDTMISHWRQAGIAYEPRRSRPSEDRSADARAAWQDRMDGYTMRYVMKKYSISEKVLRNHWRELNLEPPGQRRFLR